MLCRLDVYISTDIEKNSGFLESQRNKCGVLGDRWDAGGGGGGRKQDVQGGREEASGSASLYPIDGCAFTGVLYGVLVVYQTRLERSVLLQRFVLLQTIESVFS